MIDQSTIDRACKPQVGDKWENCHAALVVVGVSSSIEYEYMRNGQTHYSVMADKEYETLANKQIRIEGTRFTPAPTPAQPIDKRCGTCGLWGDETDKGCRYRECQWQVAGPFPPWLIVEGCRANNADEGDDCHCWVPKC